jgi:predicted nucleic acid-binding protein
MTGDNRCFVDTNALVYANLLGSLHHPAASKLLQQADAAGDELWISSQIMREYLAVVTRPQPAAQRR